MTGKKNRKKQGRYPHRWAWMMILLCLILPVTVFAADSETDFAVVEGEDARNDESVVRTEGAETEEADTEEIVDNQSQTTAEDNSDEEFPVQEIHVADAATSDQPPAFTPEFALEQVDRAAGSADLVVSGISEETGQCSVMARVWRYGAEKNFQTYTLEKNEAGDYIAHFQITDQPFCAATGNYCFRITAADFYGQEKTETLQQSFTTSGRLTVSQKSTTTVYRLSVTDLCIPGGCKTLSFLVWSKENGKDDRQWYEGTISSSGTSASALMDISAFRRYGTYICRAYAVNQAGTRTLLATETFTVSVPSAEQITAEADAAKGTFAIHVTGAAAGAGIKKVQAVVRCKSDGSDQVTYRASYLSAGNYQISSDISKHCGHLGTYTAEIFITDRRNRQRSVGSVSFRITASAGISVSSDGTETGYRILVSDIKTPMQTVRTVKALVWSDENGTDDKAWYTAEKNGDSYTVNVNIANHRTLGQYTAKLYGVTTNGNKVYLGKTTKIRVDCSATAVGSVTNLTGENGAFPLYYQITNSPSGISKVQVKVWTKSDKSDLYTYTAADQGNHYYRVMVNILKHGANLGKYHSVCYVTMGNGICVRAGSLNCSYTVKNTIYISKTASGQRKIYFENPDVSASDLQIAVWSDKDDQDDLKWYQASVSGNKGSITVKASDFRHGGTYHVHVYANGTFLKQTTFTFSYAELKTSYTEYAATLSTAKKASQMILVDADGSQAKVVMLNKNSDGSWFQMLSADGYVGRQGVGTASESSAVTPAGEYGFTMAFGIKSNPGTSISYTRLNNSHYWVDDPSSAYYNRFVSSNTVGIAWNSAEHLIDCAPSYNYALALDYNSSCIPGAGSAIFLHCSDNRPTSGCISVPESMMVKILQCLNSDCRIVIYS